MEPPPQPPTHMESAASLLHPSIAAQYPGGSPPLPESASALAALPPWELARLQAMYLDEAAAAARAHDASVATSAAHIASLRAREEELRRHTARSVAAASAARREGLGLIPDTPAGHAAGHSQYGAPPADRRPRRSSAHQADDFASLPASLHPYNLFQRPVGLGPQVGGTGAYAQARGAAAYGLPPPYHGAGADSSYGALVAAVGGVSPDGQSLYDPHRRTDPRGAARGSAAGSSDAGGAWDPRDADDGGRGPRRRGHREKRRTPDPGVEGGLGGAAAAHAGHSVVPVGPVGRGLRDAVAEASRMWADAYAFIDEMETRYRELLEERERVGRDEIAAAERSAAMDAWRRAERRAKDSRKPRDAVRDALEERERARRARAREEEMEVGTEAEADRRDHWRTAGDPPKRSERDPSVAPSGSASPNALRDDASVSRRRDRDRDHVRDRDRSRRRRSRRDDDSGSQRSASPRRRRGRRSSRRARSASEDTTADTITSRGVLHDDDGVPILSRPRLIDLRRTAPLHEVRLQPSGDGSALVPTVPPPPGPPVLTLDAIGAIVPRTGEALVELQRARQEADEAVRALRAAQDKYAAAALDARGAATEAGDTEYALANTTGLLRGFHAERMAKLQALGSAERARIAAAIHGGAVARLQDELAVGQERLRALQASIPAEVQAADARAAAAYESWDGAHGAGGGETKPPPVYVVGLPHNAAVGGIVIGNGAPQRYGSGSVPQSAMGTLLQSGQVRPGAPYGGYDAAGTADADAAAIERALMMLELQMGNSQTGSPIHPIMSGWT